LDDARMFNLMFKTHVGPLEDRASEVYLRPETAQGMFVDFKNVISSTRVRVPFGIAQQGKAFRNEITPGNFVFRVREFELMEMEYFVRPREDDASFDYWRNERRRWYTDVLGLHTQDTFNFPGTDKLRLGQASELPATVAQGDDNRLAGPARFWVGRIAFNTPDGSLRTCLAQLVAPAVLLTAAHCLRDSATGQWFANFLYVFQYQRGSGRRYSTECLNVYRDWVSKEPSHWGWDFAFVKLRGATTLGHFGWELGWQDRYQTATQLNTAVTVQNGTLVKGWSANVVGLKHGNPNEGSNGGGWIERYDPAGTSPQTNVLISLTSHYVGDDPGTSYGPYWNDTFTQLLDSAKGGCR